TS
ncbi:hypothetical protein N499_0193B, partial [Wolbachia pipientis wVitA]